MHGDTEAPHRYTKQPHLMRQHRPLAALVAATACWCTCAIIGAGAQAGATGQGGEPAQPDDSASAQAAPAAPGVRSYTPDIVLLNGYDMQGCLPS